MFALATAVQTEARSASPAPAALLVSVHDFQGKLLAGATVYLQYQGQTPGPPVRTDAQGQHHFAAVHPGSYTLRAQMPGYADASYGPFSVQAGERKNLTLTLSPASATPKSAASLQFFDQPQFTIAGVTDPTSLGGHGSNAAAPAKDELTREVVSLGDASSTVPATPSAAAEQSLRQAFERQPADFDANHRLGKFLLDRGQARESLPYLKRASQLRPADYQNNFQLALAYRDAGDYARARAILQPLLAAHDSAELHHLLGDIEEKRGAPLAAAREYQRAAQLAPSEANLFDWGSELLLHRAPEPAFEVFSQGHHLFPASLRILLGMGAASFVQGFYPQAARYFCQASDLEPANPQPYLFLGQVQEVESTPSADIATRLARFARLRPEDAQANYYYALSLRKQAETGGAAKLPQVGALLEKATRLDPGFAAAYLQLGIVYADQKRYPEAISSYQRAMAADPSLPDAHYRLAQAYMRTGDQAKARAESRVYDQLAKEKTQAADRERSHMQQFIYTLRAPTSSPSAH